MKIAITKIGANITFSSHNSSAANADIQYVIKTMYGGDESFSICSKFTRNTVLPKAIPLLDIEKVESFDEFDAVMVFNGTINFFGGNPNPSLLALYRALSKTKKAKIFYIQTDGAIFFKQLWPLIKDRDWAKGLSEDEFKIDEENVTYLTQGRDIKKMSKEIQYTRNAIIPKRMVHIPWERTILSMNQPTSVPKLSVRTYDLGFGGYIRNAHKRKRIEHYYDSPLMKTLLFGNLRDIRLNNTKVNSPIAYQDMVFTMQKCKSTVIVGDEIYENNFHTLRMYEGILAGCLVFIDRRLDKLNTFYKEIDEGNLLVDNIQEVRSQLRQESVEEAAENIRTKIIESFSKENLKQQIISEMSL